MSESSPIAPTPKSTSKKSASPQKIAIIGGGLSGLATAVHLTHSNLIADDGQDSSSPSNGSIAREVVVFEAAGRAGGVIHSEQIGDFLVDHGADMFASKPDAALRLCQALNVENRLIEPQPTRRGARIFRHNRLVPIPNGFVLMRATQWLPMLTTPLLSIKGKLRFLLERWIPSTQPAEESSGQDIDESVASFVQRRMGKEVLEGIVAPLAAGIYTADVTKLSMRATMGPIYQMEKKHGSLSKATRRRKKTGEDSVERMSTGARYGQFRAFEGGMGELIDVLVEALPTGTVQLNSPVRTISPADSGWIVTDSQGEKHRFDQVVLATPPKVSAKLLSDIDATEVAISAKRVADAFGKIESASAAIAVMGVRTSDIHKNIDTFGFVVPLSEKRKILACSFASHKFAGRAPDDCVLIRTFVGGAMQSELLDQDDDSLLQMVRDELKDMIGLEGTPLIEKVIRWPDAMPQYHVGHKKIIEQMEEAASKIEGLAIISNAMHGVGISPIIGQAEKLVAKEFAKAQEDHHA